jgi:hypothetical protein
MLQLRIEFKEEENGELVGEDNTIREAHEAMVEGVKYEVVECKKITMNEVKLPPIPPIPEAVKEIFREYARRRHAMMTTEKKEEWREKLKKAYKKRHTKESKEELSKRMSEMSRKRWGK